LKKSYSKKNEINEKINSNNKKYIEYESSIDNTNNDHIFDKFESISKNKISPKIIIDNKIIISPTNNISFLEGNPKIVDDYEIYYATNMSAIIEIIKKIIF